MSRWIDNAKGEGMIYAFFFLFAGEINGGSQDGWDGCIWIDVRMSNWIYLLIFKQ